MMMAKTLRAARTTLSAGVLMLALVACADMTDTQKRTAVGAGTGAAVGGLIGSYSGCFGCGAAIGAAVGGASGYVYDQYQKSEGN